jgi:hypothetical protein
MIPNRPTHHRSHPAAHHTSLPGSDAAAAHLNEYDALTSPGASDLTDNAAVNWEAAWIDLGGEG